MLPAQVESNEVPPVIKQIIKKRTCKDLGSEAVWEFYLVKRPFPSFSFLPGHPLTSNLLLQVEYNVNGLLQYDQFGLRFLVAQMELTHAAQLLKSLVDVPHT